MKLPWPFNGQSYRLPDDMTAEDWALRALEQAQAMREGGRVGEDANVDADGFPTARVKHALMRGHVRPIRRILPPAQSH
ncbi:hypothetical protein Lepto7375DRAFT_6346 [Leptolyngbya sp. PCC 7375]|nr:hypothetical protein Lepto7375DRAFT_6346 [Leptolyngbya sp. PCC 7375]